MKLPLSGRMEVTMTEELRKERLTLPDGPLRVVLDTDTYNEVDDQFALAYLLSSPERLRPEAIYAAPFYNQRSQSAGDGMEKSYEEILRVLQCIGKDPAGFAFRGASNFLTSLERPVSSPAVEDLIQRALSSQESPLYVVAIGAITNVASAILIEPAIIDHIVVVWLGGHVVTMESNREFNLCGDLLASQYIFDCGVPLIHMPCFGVTSHLLTTVPDLEACLRGKNALCDMLCHRVADFTSDPFGWAKEIWDVGAVAYLVNPGWFDSRIMPCPRITDDCHWAWDENRHSFRTCFFLNRNGIFRDLYTKLGGISG